MGDTNNNKDMNMNTMDPEMERPMPTRMAPMGKKPNKTGKVLLWVILVLVLIAGALVGGYFYSQNQNNQAVEKAKQDERTAAQVEIDKLRAELDKQKTAPEKTVTNATCNTDELSLALEVVDGAAGTYTYDVIFTNTGKRECTLVGYPGVSLVNDNGNMIGSPAERTQGSQDITITLAPEGKVKSTLYAQNNNNFPDGECKDGATKLRVYPPNDTGYLSVATDANLTSWCPEFQVTPVMDV